MVSENYLCFGSRYLCFVRKGQWLYGLSHSYRSTDNGCLHSTYSSHLRQIFVRSIKGNRLLTLKNSSLLPSNCYLRWHRKPCQTCYFEFGNFEWTQASRYGRISDLPGS